MSDVAHNTATFTGSIPAEHPDQQLFNSAEIRQFDEDDSEAGRRIGKLLAAFFIYTIVAMSIAIVWSITVIEH